MANSQQEFRSIITSIKKGEPAPIYILHGPESYYIDEIVALLEKSVVEEDAKDFNLNVFYGKEADIDFVISTAKQFPVMAPHRLVILKEAQTLDRAKIVLNDLVPYMRHPNGQTVFAVAYKGESLSATSALIKAAKEAGAVIFNSPAVRDWELAGQVKTYTQSKGISIDDSAIKLLCESVGAPLSKLFGEINKLVISKGADNARITVEDVTALTGASKEYNNYSLVTALVNRNYPVALRIIEYFKRNSSKNPTVVTTATLFNFFSRLVVAHYQSDKSDNGLISGLGLKNQMALREIKEAMTKYNAYQSVMAVHAIRDFDCKSKGIGSLQNEYDLQKELIFKLFTL